MSLNANMKLSISNVISVTVAGVLILTAETRRRRLKGRCIVREDYGAFIERFQLLLFPQPPPPSVKQPLSGLTFAINDVFKERKWDTRRMLTSGGMPSSHSATVTSLAACIGLQEGVGSSSIAIAVVLACVAMYDATGVRLHAGRQAEVYIPLHLSISDFFQWFKKALKRKGTLDAKSDTLCDIRRASYKKRTYNELFFEKKIH
ncbi:hypothetical protein HanPI659440_Chr00c06g0716611 [Helianthus annuus]|nr:hypothetical protein HanPI659440_Chr00c06g0716611 [Helianthus annuus]